MILTCELDRNSFHPQGSLIRFFIDLLLRLGRKTHEGDQKVKDVKEYLKRLRNLQKTDLNHWAQIDYLRMLPEREKDVKIYLKKVNIIEKEILEIEEKLSKL